MPGNDGVRDGHGAEGGGEVLVLGGREVLAREEDDLVIEQGLADGAQGFGVEGLVQVDVADLGSDRAREGARCRAGRVVAVVMAFLYVGRA